MSFDVSVSYVGTKRKHSADSTQPEVSPEKENGSTNQFTITGWSLGCI